MSASELSGVGKVILGALRRKPRTGYEIRRLVDRSARFFWAASYGQIYPELARLEDAGLVVGTNEPRGGRRRRVYRLTPAGRNALRGWLVAPGSGSELRDEGLLKLFFADALSWGEAVELVRSVRAERQTVLDRLREIDRTRPRGVGAFPPLVLAFGIELHEWMVDWYERLETELAEGVRGSKEVEAG